MFLSATRTSFRWRNLGEGDNPILSLTLYSSPTLSPWILVRGVDLWHHHHRRMHALPFTSTNLTFHILTFGHFLQLLFHCTHTKPKSTCGSDVLRSSSGPVTVLNFHLVPVQGLVHVQCCHVYIRTMCACICAFCLKPVYTLLLHFALNYVSISVLNNMQAEYKLRVSSLAESSATEGWRWDSTSKGISVSLWWVQEVLDTRHKGVQKNLSKVSGSTYIAGYIVVECVIILLHKAIVGDGVKYHKFSSISKNCVVNDFDNDSSGVLLWWANHRNQCTRYPLHGLW